MPPCVLSLKTPSDILGRRPDCQMQLRSGNSPVLLEAHCLSCDTCPLILGPTGGAIIASYLLWLITLHLFQLVIAGAETEGERGFFLGGGEMRSQVPLPVPCSKSTYKETSIHSQLQTVSETGCEKSGAIRHKRNIFHNTQIYKSKY